MVGWEGVPCWASTGRNDWGVNGHSHHDFTSLFVGTSWGWFLPVRSITSLAQLFDPDFLDNRRNSKLARCDKALDCMMVWLMNCWRMATVSWPTCNRLVRAVARRSGYPPTHRSGVCLHRYSGIATVVFRSAAALVGNCQENLSTHHQGCPLLRQVANTFISTTCKLQAAGLSTTKCTAVSP